MARKRRKSITFPQVFEDFHPDIQFWEAIADGVLKYHPKGYEDEEGNVFDTKGNFLNSNKT